MTNLNTNLIFDLANFDISQVYYFSKIGNELYNEIFEIVEALYFTNY